MIARVFHRVYNKVISYGRAEEEALQDTMDLAMTMILYPDLLIRINFPYSDSSQEQKKTLFMQK